MKTFLKTLGLIALLALAAAPMGVFAQDDTAPIQLQDVTAPAQDQSQASNPMQPSDQIQASDQSQAPNQAQAANNNSISFQTFYNQLSSMGTWIQTSDYGYVWQPSVTDPTWRPYKLGHWVNTNAGMMWASDEPFGWATYHYGRWVNLANYGWVWVPGYTWAPAWVSWRDGDDYAGWAPLPPDTFPGIDFSDPGFFGLFFGFHIGDDCDLVYGIGPGCYNFCPVAYLGDPSPWRHFADPRGNYALINRTRNVTNLNVANDPSTGRFGRVTSGGLSSSTLARSRTPISTVQLTSASSLAANGRRSGNSLAVYAPNVQSNSATGARPQHVSASLGASTVNRGTSINQPLAVNSHLRGKMPTLAQSQAATIAADSAPAGAKIARTSTVPSRTLSQPLSTYHPTAAAGANIRASSSGTALAKPVVHTSGAAATASTIKPAVHPAASSQGSSFFSNFFHSSSKSGSSVKPAIATHTSPAPTIHTSVSSPAPIFHPSVAPTYHPSVAPSFHPSVAPASHVSAAPVSHPSGGGHPAAASNQKPH